MNQFARDPPNPLVGGGGVGSTVDSETDNEIGCFHIDLSADQPPLNNISVAHRSAYALRLDASEFSLLAATDDEIVDGMQPRDGRVPFFVFPSSLTFYLEDRTTHKQILTLYNPYEFPIKFKVLCTRSKIYSVVDTEGLIKSLNRIDIVVRHNAPTISNCGVIDKFRIQMIDTTTKQVIGKKDVVATLISEKQSNTIDSGEIFNALPAQNTLFKEPYSHRHQLDQSHSSQYSSPSSTPNVEVILIAIACIIVLLLPTEGLSFFPQLQISVNFKLFCSYVLGVLTMVVLRPH